MKKGKQAILSGAVFAGLLVVCLWFVGWIGRLAFDNTCIELKEQYIRSAAGEVTGEIVTGVGFGKSMDSFYGMDRVLERLRALSPDYLEAAVLGTDGQPLYTSFEGRDFQREYLARILSDGYQEKLSGILADGGGITDFGERRSMVLPLSGRDGVQMGSVVLIYDTEGFTSTDASGRRSMTVILAVLTAAMTGYYLLLFFGKIPERSWSRLIPVLAVLVGVLAQILVLYSHYHI